MATPAGAVGRPDVLVLGAGVLGLSVAAAAAARGSSVTVLEGRPEVGGVAGAASFAWANARGGPPGPYARLRRQGLHRHRTGQDRPERWFHEAAVRDSRSAANVAAPVEGDDPEGWVDVTAYAAAQRRRLARHGGHLRTRVVAERMLPDGGVRDAAGWVWRADVVVVAAGTASARLLATAGHAPAVVGDSTGPRGFLAVAHVPRHGLEDVVLTDDVHVRPAGPDHVALQSLPLEADLAARGVGAAPGDLWPDLRAAAGRAGVRLPRGAPLAVHEAARPHAVDGLPALGWVDPCTYLLLSHSGVTLAPLLGDLVAQEVGGRSVAELQPFRPGRAPTAVAPSTQPTKEPLP